MSPGDSVGKGNCPGITAMQPISGFTFLRAIHCAIRPAIALWELHLTRVIRGIPLVIQPRQLHTALEHQPPA